MNTTDSPPTIPSGPTRSIPAPLVAPLAAGVASWVVISLVFLGLKMLMQERPEFVGQPMRVTKAGLVQESPQVFTRKVNDDVSVIRPVQADFSDVRFEMNGRRDYRGLRTIMDMSGQFRARHVVSNAFDEPIFVLFKCLHPPSQDGESQHLLAGEMKLQASTSGVQESTKEAWLWSGTLETHSSTSVEISCHVASLKGLTYRVSDKNGTR
ncbi:MAG: hypothetical protein EXS33_03275 [Pedosphaera sp.]|nr:hypothetical protein [Pedosphaera sp.]